jgi:serine/threonine protein kinase
MSGLEGLLAGRTLVKRYRIDSVIGRGGFAAVYRADDERLGRPVAVKVITLAAADDETREHLRERFQREARAAASLPQHPNVVTVHDFGTDPELGLDFLVMEFLHGEDVATHLARQRKLPLESALRVLRDAVEGVAVGHRAGLIHRDVKPGNIFLAEPHGEDPFRVCVLDFGIALAATPDQTITRLTKTGIPLSPAYASPEQLRGDHDLTCASDVFSLGVVAYQLLTGEKPLRADRTPTEPADWTPDRAIRDLNAAVPAGVEAVIKRAMAFSATDRYPDADAMADALDEAMAVVPVPPTAAAIAAPLAAAAVTMPDDDRTALQHEPSPPPPPPAPTPSKLVVDTPPGQPPYAKWGIALLVVVLLVVGGLWAITRGGKQQKPGDLIIQDQGDTTPTEVQSGGPRVTGQIIEQPTAPPPVQQPPTMPMPTFPSPSASTPAPAPRGNDGRIFFPETNPATQPRPQQPAAAAPAPAPTPARGADTPPTAQPSPAPAQPAPAQPASPPAGGRTPAQPANPPAGGRTPADTAGPKLLGSPADNPPAGSASPAGGGAGGGGGGGGNSRPAPADTTRPPGF